MSVQLVRRRFSVDEYHQMAEAGILREDDRVELLDGEVVEMSPIGRRHAACVKRLNQIFSQLLGRRVLIGVQDPIQLSNRSEPQPDITLLQPRPDFYAAGHPQPQDIFLLVEVADTTIEADRDVKIPLYASSGITEVWLVNLNEDTIAVYRQPAANGYKEVRTLRRGESLDVQAFFDIQLTVDEVLG